MKYDCHCLVSAWGQVLSLHGLALVLLQGGDGIMDAIMLPNHGHDLSNAPQQCYPVWHAMRLLVDALVTIARVCYCFQPLGRNPLLNHFPPAGKISISGPVTRLGWLRNYPPLVRQSDGWRNPWLSWPGSNALKTECKLHNPAVCCDLWHCRAIGT